MYRAVLSGKFFERMNQTMKRKGSLKRILSGILAAVTLFTTAMSPIGVSAAEPDPQAKLPLLEEVRDQLDPEEIVTAKDHVIQVGEKFDVTCDFSDIEILDDEKVRVTFQEAKNEQGEDFSTEHADTYQAVYYVEPQKTDHPVYQVRRNLIVVAPEASARSVEAESISADTGQTEETADDGEADQQTEPLTEKETETLPDTEAPTETGETETSQTEPEASDTGEPETEGHSESELDVAIEEAQKQDTLDEESGLSLADVLEQATEGGVDIGALEEGETVTFQAKARANTGNLDVSVTRGTAYYYADYGLGTYVTYHYTVQFGSVSATAYCVQPSKPGPGDGTYKISKLPDGGNLAKVCYYGTKASEENGFFDQMHPDFSAGKRFIITHLAAAYANGSGDAFSGTNATGQELAMELYNYCVSQPDIPSVEMSFSDADVTAYIEGNSQRTKVITFKADELQTITMKLPDGVKLHNETTGETSAAGADVEISGGTKFYLTAPLTQAEDVKGSWSATMKGSITKDFSAYKITTGAYTQDLALVFGEGVDDEKYIDFKVTWVQQATVEIIKKDRTSNAAIAGAVYGIYRDKEGKDLIVKMPATDSQGKSSVKLTKTQDTVYLKEISVPAGYVLDASSYNIDLVAGKTTSKTVTDQEQLGNLTVYKNGEVLTGASVTENGVTFTYTQKKQKGAVYNVYAGADIVAADGTTVYKKGALVKEGLTTGDDGSATLGGLHLGTYIITETKAPENLVCTGESKTVTLSYGGSNVEVVMGSVTFQNARQKAAVSVVKQDNETKNPLDGGIYGLYAGSDIRNDAGNVVVEKDTLIEKVTTGSNGSASYKADLPIGNSYYIKELQAPEDYYINSEEEYSFTFRYTTDDQAAVSFTHTFENERVDATIQLTKEDAETGSTPQGDATLEGAVYGLFAREDIVHPDGKTGVLYEAGSQVATLKTDKEGKASIEDLYLGKYFIKEITPPVGYLLDEKEYDLDCSYEGDHVKTVERTATSKDQVIKQPFQIIKAADNGKTDADLLAGAGFSAYLVSSLAVKEDGTYDFASAEPIVLTSDGKTEMFTDERGYACSIAIPYGTYIVRETTTPHNFSPVDDFIVTVTENSTEPQTWRILLDEEFSAKLKIIKKDDETGKAVLLPDTEFKIYDMDAEEYVEQVTTYPTTTVHSSFFTNEQGYLILPENLLPGNYRIEEVTAPDGYVLNENYVEIKVDSNTAYQVDPVSKDLIIEVAYENHPVKGELVIQKEGEALNGYDGDFQYGMTKLSGAVFQVYAAEDIYTADHQVDADGNRLLEYAAGTLVATVTTDEEGKATVEDLPLGKYRIEEVTAPDGYVLNTSAQEVEFVYDGQDQPVISEEVTFTDERQKVSIIVEKQDEENGALLPGASFGLYNQEAILVGEETIVEADTLLETVVSDETGQAVFTEDLPFGKYYVKELAAPDGYISSDEILDFEFSYQGQNIPVVELKAVKANKPTTVEVTKSDITTGVELSGASLTVLDQEGNEVDSWVSVKDEPHVIKRLTVGETYTLRETFAPYGYLKATEITFTVEDTGDVQKVEMLDEVPTATLIVNKKGEFLESVTLVSEIKGVVEHIFNYITGNLKDVTFEVYAAEDIQMADGVSGYHYHKDELVATITTDDSGIAKVENLPVGKYYVVEKETADGYVLDAEPRYVDLSYRDQDTSVVTFDEDWQNNRQKATVSVLKKEKDTDRVLEGAIFGLFAGEDILSESGNVLIEADTVIELKTTDADGRIAFVADLPVGYAYYVKELYAPDGFVTVEEAQEFTFDYQGSDTETVPYEFTFENEATTVEFTKSDLTTGEELPGASLKVVNESGETMDEWISEKEPHVIKELVVGQTYTLVETKPADGYVTAESVEFTVENTSEIQKVEMEDDVTKVEISKTDITGEKELPGATLTILDKDGNVVETWVSGEKAHYIEKLPIGSYTLREEQAPDGYRIAEDITFEVEDTPEIQKVTMKDEAETVDVPKTGDDTKLWIPALALAVSGICLAGVVISRKRRKHDDD